MQVAILTHVLTTADAVGADVLGMAETLRATGHTVRLVAEKAQISADVVSYEQFVPADGEVLIYHHSVACPAAVKVLKAARGPVVVKYHNITPAKFFLDVDPHAERRAADGFDQLTALCQSKPVVWVDSSFNGEELRELVPECRPLTLPPFHQANELLRATPEPIAHLDGWPTTILCVGRMAPNKNLELAIEAFANYRKQHDADARLVFAGPQPFPRYSEKIAILAEELKIASSISVMGRVSVAQLKALYCGADLLLVSSAHEGFCVPVVEAMALGLPVVCVNSTALPETGGEAIRLCEANATDLANAMHEVVQSLPTREILIRLGRERYESQLSHAAIRTQFLHRFDELIA